MLLLTLFLLMVSQFVRVEGNNFTLDVHRTNSQINCRNHQIRSFLLSCEYSCKDFKQVCNRGFKCVCPPNLFRNGDICVEKNQCPNVGKEPIKTKFWHLCLFILKLAANFLPRLIGDIIKLFLTASKVAKFLTHMK